MTRRNTPTSPVEALTESLVVASIHAISQTPKGQTMLEELREDGNSPEDVQSAFTVCWDGSVRGIAVGCLQVVMVTAKKKLSLICSTDELRAFLEKESRTRSIFARSLADEDREMLPIIVDCVAKTLATTVMLRKQMRSTMDDDHFFLSNDGLYFSAVPCVPPIG